MRTPNIRVVGSINMNMTTTADMAPIQGETVLGRSFATYPGGKGANQAVAAALSVTKIGAQNGMPTRIQLERFIAGRRDDADEKERNIK
ncbi:PfkB family carbohydrate kinase [Lentibacillus daqui]|uniref:PfkB family carbohydrate kinase n=1 Tax=Lentibacillus daqui TaxID=2911514 RepID=UPI003F6F0B56